MTRRSANAHQEALRGVRCLHPCLIVPASPPRGDEFDQRPSVVLALVGS